MLKIDIQEKTYSDLISKLKQFGICNLVRPIGFGKTYLLMRLATEYKFNYVFYFYPRESVRVQSLESYTGSSRRIVYVSYNKLARYTELIEDGTFLKTLGVPVDVSRCLFVFDESHYIGGDKTSIAFTKLYEKYGKKNLFVGSTATALRRDGVDVTAKYFKGSVVFYYDANMAISDGLYKRPKCFKCIFDVESEEKDILSVVSNQPAWGRMSSVARNGYSMFIKNKLLKASVIHGAGNTYKKGIESSLAPSEREYLRFLVYFYSYEILDSQKDTLMTDFKMAFPDMKVNIHVVNDHESLYKLKDLKVEKGVIDLILNVDMVSLGYHDSALNGVIMFRSTDSDTVFGQNCLRGLSIVNSYPTLIFDMVGNFYKASKRYYDGEKEKGIRIVNTGGTGYIESCNIDVVSFESDISSVLDVTELDRIKKAFKLDVLVQKGIMPISVACKELGLPSSELYYGFIEHVKPVRKYLYS